MASERCGLCPCLTSIVLLEIDMHKNLSEHFVILSFENLKNKATSKADYCGEKTEKHSKMINKMLNISYS